MNTIIKLKNMGNKYIIHLDKLSLTLQVNDYELIQVLLNNNE